MTLLKKILEGKEQKLLVLFDQGMVSGSNFVIGILIARFLGIEQFGVYGFIYLIYLFCLGLQQAFFVIPMYSLGPAYSTDTKKAYLNSLLVIQIVFTLFFSLICFLALTFIPISISPKIQELGGLIAITSLFVLLQDFLRRLFLFQGFFKSLILLDGIAYLFQIGLLVLMYFLDEFNLESCIKMVCFTMLISVIYGFSKIRKTEFNLSILKNTLIRHWVFSKWLLARAILTYSSGNFFIIAAGTILGPVAIGAIKMGQNLHGVMNVVFLAIENHVPIVSANLFQQKGRQALYDYLKRMTIKSLLLCFGLGSAVLIFSTWLISNLYGAEYLEYAYVLIWFALINLLLCISMPLRFALRTFERTQSLFFATALSALFGLLLAYPLIETFKMNGLLFGLIMSQVIMIFYLAYSVFQSRKKVLLRT